MLFESARHEPLLAAPWDAGRAHDAHSRDRAGPAAVARPRARLAGASARRDRRAAHRTQVALPRRGGRLVGAVVPGAGRRRDAARAARRTGGAPACGLSRRAGHRRSRAVVLPRRSRRAARPMAPRRVERGRRPALRGDPREHSESHERGAVGGARHDGRRLAHVEVDRRGALARSLPRQRRAAVAHVAAERARRLPAVDAGPVRPHRAVARRGPRLRRQRRPAAARRGAAGARAPRGTPRALRRDAAGHRRARRRPCELAVRHGAAPPRPYGTAAAVVPRRARAS